VGKQSRLTHRNSDTPAFFQGQIGDVIEFAQLREDRGPEILAQVTETAAFWSTILPMHDGKTPATTELLVLATDFAKFIEMRFKHEFACPRPVDYSPQVQPMIPTPMHGAFPMGHMCEAAVVAHILSFLVRKSTAMASTVLQLRRLAWRIGENRIVAGVHFPVDLLGGLALGNWIGEYLLACAGQSGKKISGTLTFDAATSTEVQVRQLYMSGSPVCTAPQNPSEIEVTEVPFLTDLLARSEKEWKWLVPEKIQL
jgi:hypothetical protein